LSNSVGTNCTWPGMVHSVSGKMRGVQVKLWHPLRTCHIWVP